MIPRALIFDVDGTLAETEDAHRAAFNAAFAEAGMDWHWDAPLYGRLLDITGGKERIRHHADSLGLNRVGPAGLDNAAIARLHARKTQIYGAAVAMARLELRPGVARLIAEARAAGVILAIATTTSPANVDALLTATLGPGSPAWFAMIAAGDQVAAKKPAPDVYRLVLDRLHLDPARCIAFEDSENGIRAARAAGLPTLVTVSRYTTHHRFPGALAVLDHLGEPGRPCAALAGLALPCPFVDLAALAALTDAAPR